MNNSSLSGYARLKGWAITFQTWSALINPSLRVLSSYEVMNNSYFSQGMQDSKVGLLLFQSGSALINPSLRVLSPYEQFISLSGYARFKVWALTFQTWVGFVKPLLKSFIYHHMNNSYLSQAMQDSKVGLLLFKPDSALSKPSLRVLFIVI